MPRLTTRVPKYCLHKASGQAVVTLNGRDIYLGRHDSPESKSKYRSLLVEWEQQGRQHGLANHKGPAIDELILAYLEHAAGYYVKDGRPTSEQTTLKAALRPLHDLYGGMPAAEFSPTKLVAVRHVMITDLGWCRTHTNKQVSRIKSMFRWAVEHELIDASVHHALLAVRGLRKGRSEAREPDPITPVAEPHVEEVLPHVSRQVAAMVRLQLLTGTRSLMPTSTRRSCERSSPSVGRRRCRCSRRRSNADSGRSRRSTWSRTARRRWATSSPDVWRSSAEGAPSWWGVGGSRRSASTHGR